MGLRFPAQIYGNCFFVTTTFKEWRNLGDVNGMYEALTDSLIFYTRRYECRLLGYVLMPSHIHLVLVIDGSRLSHFMRDFKKFISQKGALDLKLLQGGIWMPRFDRVVITNEGILRTKLNYIHFNPVKHGLVERPEDWKWSSATDYLLGRPGPIFVFRDWA